MAARRKRDRVRICFPLWLVRISFGEFEGDVGVNLLEREGYLHAPEFETRVFAVEPSQLPFAVWLTAMAINGVTFPLDQHVFFERRDLAVMFELAQNVVAACGW